MEYNHRFYLSGLTNGFWRDGPESCKGWVSLFRVNSKPKRSQKLSSFRGRARTAKLRNKTEVLGEVFAEMATFCCEVNCLRVFFHRECFGTPNSSRTDPDISNPV